MQHVLDCRHELRIKAKKEKRQHTLGEASCGLGVSLVPLDRLAAVDCSGHEYDQ